MNRSSSLVPPEDSHLPLATRLPNFAQHLPLSRAATEVSFSSEASENLSDPSFVWLESSISQSSSPASSQDIRTPDDDGDEGEEIELPSLSSLLKVGPSSTPPGFRNKMTQKDPAEPVLQT